jgi:hypothetical protein
MVTISITNIAQFSHIQLYYFDSFIICLVAVVDVLHAIRMTYLIRIMGAMTLKTLGQVFSTTSGNTDQINDPTIFFQGMLSDQC